MILLPHNSPQPTDADVKRHLWSLQEQLKNWFAFEILEAEQYDRDRKGSRWWVWQSSTTCRHCGLRKLRVTIRAHPSGPFYVCVICGSIETLLDLTR